MSEKIQKLPRNTRIVATLLTGKGTNQRAVWKRYYAFFDTAMPRAVQLAMTYGNEGDIVEFYSREYGFQIGILRIKKRLQFDIEMSPIVKTAPNLLKLISADRDSPAIHKFIQEGSRGKRTSTGDAVTHH